MFRIIFLIFGSAMALPGNAKIESMLQNPVQYKVFCFKLIYEIKNLGSDRVRNCSQNWFQRAGGNVGGDEWFPENDEIDKWIEDNFDEEAINKMNECVEYCMVDIQGI